MKKAEVTSNFKVTWFPASLGLLIPLIHVGDTGVRTTFSYMRSTETSCVSDAVGGQVLYSCAWFHPASGSVAFCTSLFLGPASGVRWDKTEAGERCHSTLESEACPSQFSDQSL